MTTDQNKALVHRMAEEGLGKNNWNIVAETYAANYVDHQPTPIGLPAGLEGLKRFTTMFRTAFPDLSYTIDDEIADGDRVVQRVTGQGTMKGPFAGMSATGKHATWSEIHISRLRDGKIVEHWGSVDQLGMMQQLGLAPVPTPRPS
jgi:predicted ester cyclase